MRNKKNTTSATTENVHKRIPKRVTEEEQRWAEFIKSMNDFTRFMKESLEDSARKSAEDKKKFEASIKAMHKELGGISNSNGEVAEAYFVNSFAKSMSFAGQIFNGHLPNLTKKDKQLNLQGEYDLVLYNCTSAAIIEIKYKARKEDVENLINKVPVFKQLFPEYANYNLYLGLAAFHITKETEKASIQQGVAVIKQLGKSMVVNDAHLKVY